MILINLSSNLRRWVNTTTPVLQRTKASCGRPEQSAQSRDRSRDSWSPGLSRLSRPHLTFLFLDLVWKALLSYARFSCHLLSEMSPDWCERAQGFLKPGDSFSWGSSYLNLTPFWYLPIMQLQLSGDNSGFVIH